MIIPTVLPPPKTRRGQRARLMPLQEIELWSWYQAKLYLGTYKSKARELGVPVGTLREVISRMRRRKRS